MSSTLLTAATDIFVIAGAAAVATAAYSSTIPSFQTSLGAGYDDDSLLVAETNNATGTPGQYRPSLQEKADNDNKAVTVHVTEIAVTPPLVELQGGGFFAGAKAA